MLVEFKNILFGFPFTFQGQEYIKTNFNRGYFFQDGRKVFRPFKKSVMVEKNYTAEIE